MFTHAKSQESYTLPEALKLARTQNLMLKTARFEMEMAQSDIITAGLRLNPTLENESVQLMKHSEFANGTPWYNGQNREVFWHISKPFQWAGQRKFTIEAANKSYAHANENYASLERELFLEVAQKWLLVWTTQKQLDIIYSAKSNIDSLMNINQKRYQNQVITQTELFRTELLAKQYAIQYKTARQEVKTQQKELGLLLNMEEEIPVDTASGFIYGIPENIDSLIIRSLEERSDIRSAKRLIDVSETNVNLQKSLAVPQPELGVIFNPMNAIPYFGVSFSIDLPFFNRNQGEIQKSFQVREQAQSQLTTLQKQLETEVAVAHANFRLQQQNSRDFEILIEQSEIILENVKQTYLMGGTTIIDLLEAQRSWLETRQQHYETIQAYMESHIQLLYATGLIHQLAL